ncbi:MAG: hypothetical protein SGI92_05355 [Bryobacteraceae bacterium]|nr:hypothetical protein [Bryobacteraceae bacterium]
MNSQNTACDCGCMGVGPAISHLLNNLGPKEARDHFRAARVEFLKGMRSLIDARIDQINRDAQPQSTGTSVPVE